jgi:ribokinase
LVRRAFESADGATTILNPAPAAELPPELISVTNIVVPNEHELEIIGGAEPLLAAGCDAVVVTLGGAGVDIVTRDGTEHIDAFTVDVIDTTGAGDAFCGALASQLAAGADLVSAARWAAAAGALATTIAGAVPAQPRASSIRALLGR